MTEAAAPAAGSRWARAWRFWVDLVGRREPGTALAAFRVAVGLSVLFAVGSMVADDMVGVLWVDADHGGVWQLGPGNRLLRLLGGPTPRAVWTLVAVALASGALVAAGLLGRAAAFVALHSYQALFTAFPVTAGGYDRMITNALWMLVLGASTATLSADCRIRTGKWRSDAPIAAWPRYLIIFQLVVIYTSTGLHKLSATWTPAGGYSALYWVLQEPTWRRFDTAWAAWAYPLTQVATALTWHWELSAPLLLLVYWYRATPERPGRLRALFNRRDLRIPYAAVGVLLHLGILVLLNVGPFSWISFAYYLCLWRPEEIEAAARRAAGARGRLGVWGGGRR